MRVAINGLGLVGRALLIRLAREPGLDVAAVNEAWLGRDEVGRRLRAEAPRGPAPVEVEGGEGGPLRCGPARPVWLAEPDPGRLPWGALGVGAVVEAARLFDRAELEAQSDGGRIPVVMTGDLRRGPPDLTLVLGVNDALYRPGSVVLCAGSDRTQSLVPVLSLVHGSCGLERVRVCHLRPPYPAHGRALSARRDDGGHLARVMPELEGIYHGFRVASPAAEHATAWLDLSVARPLSREGLEGVLAEAGRGRFAGALGLGAERGSPAGSTLSAFIPAPGLNAEGSRVWLELTYDPVVSYTERLVEILRFLAARAPPPC